MPTTGVYFSYDMNFLNTTIPVSFKQQMFRTRHCLRGISHTHERDFSAIFSNLIQTRKLLFFHRIYILTNLETFFLMQYHLSQRLFCAVSGREAAHSAARTAADLSINKTAFLSTWCLLTVFMTYFMNSTYRQSSSVNIVHFICCF